MALPKVRIERNLTLLAHHDLNAASNVGEGMAVKIMPDGRRFLFVANEDPPVDLSVLDVTHPARPELVWQLALPHGEMRSNSLALQGDTLLSAYQVSQPGNTPAGFRVWDVSRPERPQGVGFFDTSGPHSRGCHRVWFSDPRYAHISTGAADFEPNNPKDDQFYMIVDVAERAHPKEVGRWWLPGQRRGDRESLARHRPPSVDAGFRVHHTLSYPQRPDRAYLGYIDGGLVILDISDRGQPALISRLDYHPPFPGWTHTVLPLFGRDLLIVADEAQEHQPAPNADKRLWVVDVRDEAHPVTIATMPTPPESDALGDGGRIGPHNIHENEPIPGSAKLERTVVATWFNAGLRIFDIRDPFDPKEIAAFLPETPAGQEGCRISDVYVDDRGVIYCADRANGGLYFLQYTGNQRLD